LPCAAPTTRERSRADRALGALDPTLPVVAEIVETGESIPIDVVAVAGVIYEDEPAHDVAVLRPLEDWQAG